MGAVNGLTLIRPGQFSYTGTGGQIQNLGEISYTAVSNLTIDNIFNKDYNDYVMLMRFTGTVNGEWIYYQFRAGGATNNTSKYSTQIMRGNYNASVNPSRSVNQTSGWLAYYGSNAWNNILKIDIQNPNALAKTFLRGEHGGDFSVTYVQSVTTATGSYNEAIPFDGIRLFTASGTITGTLNIYGVRK